VPFEGTKGEVFELFSLSIISGERLDIFVRPRCAGDKLDACLESLTSLVLSSFGSNASPIPPGALRRLLLVASFSSLWSEGLFVPFEGTKGEVFELFSLSIISGERLDIFVRPRCAGDKLDACLESLTCRLGLFPLCPKEGFISLALYPSLVFSRTTLRGRFGLPPLNAEEGKLEFIWSSMLRLRRTFISDLILWRLRLYSFTSIINFKFSCSR